MASKGEYAKELPYRYEVAATCNHEDGVEVRLTMSCPLPLLAVEHAMSLPRPEGQILREAPMKSEADHTELPIWCEDRQFSRRRAGECSEEAEKVCLRTPSRMDWP